MSIKTQENLSHNLKKTSLFLQHQKLKAKIVPFAGWEMPVQYPHGLIAEHNAVRNSVGIFDVSHMGEIEITGTESKKFLQELTINDLENLNTHQAQYNALCNEDGKILDDIIIYKKSDENYFICVNASNIEKDFNWIKSYSSKYNVTVSNLSNQYGQIAIQGPKSRDVLSKIIGNSIHDLKYYYFYEVEIFNCQCLVARTGYTGELGFEVYCPAEITEALWEKLLECGKPFSLLPCGLGARDTLRLEVGYLLCGTDMDENNTPLECGLKWITKLEKPTFVGKDAIVTQCEKGVSKRLVGFEMCDRAIGRHGYKVFHPEQKEKQIGIVTSGSPSPTLAKNIGFMYLEKAFSKIDTHVLIEVRGALKPAQVVKKTFYKSKSLHS